jgi:hypothetical protein
MGHEWSSERQREKMQIPAGGNRERVEKERWKRSARMRMKRTHAQKIEGKTRDWGSGDEDKKKR